MTIEIIRWPSRLGKLLFNQKEETITVDPAQESMTGYPHIGFVLFEKVNTIEPGYVGTSGPDTLVICKRNGDYKPYVLLELEGDEINKRQVTAVDWLGGKRIYRWKPTTPGTQTLMEIPRQKSKSFL